MTYFVAVADRCRAVAATVAVTGNVSATGGNEGSESAATLRES